MKKLNLKTTGLNLKKEEISTLTQNEMKAFNGGEAAITDQCNTNGCTSDYYTCTDGGSHTNCPSKDRDCGTTPHDPPFGWSWLVRCGVTLPPV